MPELSRGAQFLTALFAGSGVLHVVRPQVFEPMVPHALPAKRELVYASGLGELALAAGLMHPATRKHAGVGSVAMLLAVFPANVQMAIDSHRLIQQKGSSRNRQIARAVAVARLPLQAPLIHFARGAIGSS